MKTYTLSPENKRGTSASELSSRTKYLRTPLAQFFGKRNHGEGRRDAAIKFKIDDLVIDNV